MKVISDLHIGAKRRAGTTPQSQAALRTHIFSEFRDLMTEPFNQHIVVNGDLFDNFTVDSRDLLETFEIMVECLEKGNSITLIMGNHDAVARSTQVSSFHTLCRVLKSMTYRFNFVDHTHGLTWIGGWSELPVLAISHQLNQDLFDIEIKKAVEMGGDGRVLLLHCNVGNKFAEDDMHSLNLNDEQLDALMRSGWQIVCGHEHQMRTLRGGRVVIPGNQIVTSISDCLNCDAKYYVWITDKVELVKLFDVKDVFTEVDWQDEVLMDDMFVRVTGTATAEQASEVVDAVASFRKESDAFVVANAVKIDGVCDFDSLTEASFDDIKKIDVLGLMLEEFNERERVVIKELLE
jgi:DNA repair exonuclease SbcCD nuclease subunit